jgi:stage IV sporulation protein FB
LRGYKTNKNLRKNRTKKVEVHSQNQSAKAKIKLHPLFIAVGIFYCFTGDLPLFLLSCLVAVEHECAHAFAAAKLGYRLNQMVLMPFGAVVDVDLNAITLKDEIKVALCGPLCNFITAFLFASLWWFAPTTYAFTDTAYYASIAICLVNLLPAYPLDGGRIFKCLLQNSLEKSRKFTFRAEKIATILSKALTLLFALILLLLFLISLFKSTRNFSLLLFSCFLFFGAIGNKEKAAYAPIDFSFHDALSRGVELKRIAVLSSCKIKSVFKYLSKSAYLVLEVYDENERHLFDLPQNQLSSLFLISPSPNASLSALWKNGRNTMKNGENQPF